MPGRYDASFYEEVMRPGAGHYLAEIANLRPSFLERGTIAYDCYFILGCGFTWNKPPLDSGNVEAHLLVPQILRDAIRRFYLRLFYVEF